jgi:hypothetical protein
MAVKSTTVTFSDVVGYDDFPTEIKFSVEMEHCKPRDNAGIETMFNGGKGRFYAFTNKSLENSYHSVDITQNFKSGGNASQEANGNGVTTTTNHSVTSNERMKIIGGNLNF